MHIEDEQAPSGGEPRLIEHRTLHLIVVYVTVRSGPEPRPISCLVPSAHRVAAREGGMAGATSLLQTHGPA